MIIEKAEKEDLHKILDLQYLAYQSEAKLFNNSNIPPLKQTLSDLKNEYQKGLILKALDENNVIIGSVRAYSDNGTVYIGKLMVHPEKQRQGIGTKLLLEIEKAYPGQRYELFTSTKSKKNIMLYEQLGYKIFDEKQITNELRFVYLEKCKTGNRDCWRKNREMAVYEFDGEKYKQASKHQKEWGNNLISQLHLCGNEVVLDLGCGDGVLSEQIAKLVPQGKVIGIDASYGMLQTAKKLECDNLSFVQIDINDMDFSDEFDIIFSNAALHWVLNHSLLLNHSFRALKQGGSIHWNFAGDGTCAAFYDVVRMKMRDKQYAPYFNGFIWPWFMPSKEQYKALIEPVGFSKIEIVEENKDRYFSDTGEMIKWIDQPSIVPFIKCIPDNMKESFRREVIQLMVEKTKQKDGTCFETFRRINVTAIK